MKKNQINHIYDIKKTYFNLYFSLNYLLKTAGRVFLHETNLKTKVFGSFIFAAMYYLDNSFI